MDPARPPDGGTPRTPPGMPGRRLVAAARAVKGGTGTLRSLAEAFLVATVYAPAPARSGVRVVTVAGERVVPVFSSETELARFAGRARWFAVEGRDFLDLLALLPEPVALGLDLAGPHGLRLDPATLGRGTTVPFGEAVATERGADHA